MRRPPRLTCPYHIRFRHQQAFIHWGAGSSAGQVQLTIDTSSIPMSSMPLRCNTLL